MKEAGVVANVCHRTCSTDGFGQRAAWELVVSPTPRQIDPAKCVPCLFCGHAVVQAGQMLW